MCDTRVLLRRTFLLDQMFKMRWMPIPTQHPLRIAHLIFSRKIRHICVLQISKDALGLMHSVHNNREECGKRLSFLRNKHSRYILNLSSSHHAYRSVNILIRLLKSSYILSIIWNGNSSIIHKLLIAIDLILNFRLFSIFHVHFVSGSPSVQISAFLDF